jgi:predicted nuclease of predicted toxin-antitoxin system
LKLLVDEMWPAWIAERLRERGHDVGGVQERPKLRSEPDSVIFAVAQQEERAILTDNIAHFRALARLALHQGDSHYGLVLTSNVSSPRGRPQTFSRIVEATDNLLSQHPKADALRNQERWL